MKPAVKPADIALPAWLKRIGEDRIARIQTRLLQIHNSAAGLGYVPLRRAFDVVAFELCGDPEFENLFFPIQGLVVDLAKELRWIRPEWLTEFNPNRALPHILWELSIRRTLSGEPWRGAYDDRVYPYHPIQSAAAPNMIRSSKAEAQAPGPNELNDPRDEPNDPVRLETEVTRQLAADACANCNEGDPVANERAALLTAYKLRGRQQGIRISDEMVAKAAKPGDWNDRTMVGWWKRNDPRCKPPHDRKIRAVLARDPSSIWEPNIKPRHKAK